MKQLLLNVMLNPDSIGGTLFQHLNNRSRNKFGMTILACCLFLLSVTFTKALAATTPNCQLLYGSPDSCIKSDKILLDKTVQEPKGLNLVQRIDESGDIFTVGQNVIFQLEMTNTSNAELKNIQVQDIFPQGVGFVSGTGRYNESNRTLIFTVSSLKPKETKSYTIVSRIAEDIDLGTDRGCRVNQAKVTVGQDVSRDNILICIQKNASSPSFQGQGTRSTPTSPTPVKTKGGLAVHTPPKNLKNTPPTGPEMLALIGLAPTAIAGYLLRRRATK